MAMALRTPLSRRTVLTGAASIATAALATRTLAAQPLAISGPPSHRPLVIAHRGGAGLRPENTLAAIRHALTLGADGVEIDVHLTGDGVPVVHHDPKLRPDTARTLGGGWLTGEPPALAALTLNEVKAYDVGRLDPESPYAGLYPRQEAVDGETIPTLAEALSVLKARSKTAIAFIELKTPFAAGAFEHDALVDATVETIRKADMADRVRLMAFEWRALDRAAERAPPIARGHTTIPGRWLADDAPPEHQLLPKATRDGLAALVRTGPAFMRGYAPAAPDGWTKALIDEIARDAAGFWTANHYDVTPELVRHATAKNVGVSAWTVDRRTDIERVAGLGVSAILTDYPDTALNVVGAPA
ncbi:MAG: glycerophosphodiester phosphodiesterase family protein [Pseudomonadota bacterium]